MTHSKRRHGMRYKFMVLGLLLFGVQFCGVPSDAQEVIGVISSLEGVADIARDSHEAAFIKESDPVYLNDRIRTKSYSKVEITFNDKSVVKLAPNTCLIVDEFKLDDKKKRELAEFKLTRGKIEAVVAKTNRPDSFVIKTPNATGKVKGSDIFMFYEAGKTGALVKEGLMTVAGQSVPDKAMSVSPGNFSMVQFDKEPTQTRPYLEAELNRFTKEVAPILAKRSIFLGATQEMTAALSNVMGEVRIYKKGAKDWRSVRMNELFQEGDKIQTGANGTAEIRLSNGNMIYLLANTEFAAAKLVYNAKTGEYENSFESSMGKVKAVVVKLGTNSKFQVKTPTAVCGVRGTVVYLNIGPAGTQGYYEGGGGYMNSTITGQTQIIGPGQNAATDPAGNVSAPTFTSTEQSMSLDQSFAGQQLTGEYSSPNALTSPESGSSITNAGGQNLAATTDNSLLAGPASIVMADAPTFDQTHVTASPSTQSSSSQYYSTLLTTLVEGTAPPFKPTQTGVSHIMDVKLYSSNGGASGTWTASFNGTTMGQPIYDWTLTVQNGSGDVITITGLGIGTPGTLPMAMVGAQIDPSSTVDGHQLTGVSVTGTFNNTAGSGDQGYTGTASGTF